jgi:hypothetical protein
MLFIHVGDRLRAKLELEKYLSRRFPLVADLPGVQLPRLLKSWGRIVSMRIAFLSFAYPRDRVRWDLDVYLVSGSSGSALGRWPVAIESLGA